MGVAGQIGPYAAHGGLVLLSDIATARPTGFHSAVTVGGLQCRITFRFDDAERQALNDGFLDFLAWCAELARAATDAPVPRDKLVKLGLGAAEVPAPGG